jgi:undecaprenyl-diphosphatase
MVFWEISLYSLIQGITEFLPISSSAHLFVLERLLNWSIPGRTMAIAAHLGSLFAVILYLKYDIINIIDSLIKVKVSSQNHNITLLKSLIIITVPIIVIGLFVFKNLDEKLLTLNVIAWSSIIGASLLYIADNFKAQKRDIFSLSLLDCLFIGILQVFSLVPGASRAGVIITAARILNINRIDATKLGLYTSLPTIIGAVLLELIWLINNTSNNEKYLYILITCIMSFIFSYLSIILLLKWLKTNSFTPFILYRILLGIVILYFINI